MSHYYSENQDSELNLTTISTNVFSFNFEFYVGSGVFSKSKLDYGSKVLVENAIINDKNNVLDLGCGYGPIGIILAKKYSSIKIVMTDINKRAVMLARRNILLNKLDKKRFKVYQGNSYRAFKDDTPIFDTILLNPPQTAGKQICLDMMVEAKKFLIENGSLQIVARHNKGGSTFKKFLKDEYGNCEEICKDKGFRVYVSYKKSKKDL